MLEDDSKRYVIIESSKFRGAYIVLDTETMEETPFYNLISAKTYLRSTKK